LEIWCEAGYVVGQGDCVYDICVFGETEDEKTQLSICTAEIFPMTIEEQNRLRISERVKTSEQL